MRVAVAKASLEVLTVSLKYRYYNLASGQVGPKDNLNGGEIW
jgi:hypothetical protein